MKYRYDTTEFSISISVVSNPRYILYMARNKAAYDHWLFVLCVLVFAMSSCYATDADTLIKFKNSLSDTSALDNWNASTNPCNASQSNWAGVRCRDGSVFGLALMNMSLAGLIDIDTLSELPALRTISFMNNSFGGPLPSVKKLGSLLSVYFSENHFSGEIPDDAFGGMGDSLKKVYLAKNEFTGKIPSSLVALPKLSELDLGDNQFSGRIPNFQQQGWKVMNLANNRLEGRIPSSLRNLNATEFTGK